MKKLIFSAVVAMSLMVGITGSANAVHPDNAACTALAASEALTGTVFNTPAFSPDACEAHGAP